MTKTKVNSFLNNLIKQTAWESNYQSQLNLNINFGKPHLRITKRKGKNDLATVRGEWWLWIFYANWKIKNFDNSNASIFSSYKRISIALSRINGQKLLSIKFISKTGITNFTFNRGSVLTVIPFEHRQSDLWSIYHKKSVLSVQSDGRYYIGKSSLDKKPKFRSLDELL